MSVDLCRPPEGTPDGQVCWLQLLDKIGRHRTYELWQWIFEGYWSRFGDEEPWSEQEMIEQRWRFHSLVAPPERKMQQE